MRLHFASVIVCCSVLAEFCEGIPTNRHRQKRQFWNSNFNAPFVSRNTGGGADFSNGHGTINSGDSWNIAGQPIGQTQTTTFDQNGNVGFGENRNFGPVGFGNGFNFGGKRRKRQWFGGSGGFNAPFVSRNTGGGADFNNGQGTIRSGDSWNIAGQPIGQQQTTTFDQNGNVGFGEQKNFGPVGFGNGFNFGGRRKRQFWGSGFNAPFVNQNSGGDAATDENGQTTINSGDSWNVAGQPIGNSQQTTVDQDGNVGFGEQRNFGPVGFGNNFNFGGKRRRRSDFGWNQGFDAPFASRNTGGGADVDEDGHTRVSGGDSWNIAGQPVGKTESVDVDPETGETNWDQQENYGPLGISNGFSTGDSSEA